MFIEDLINSIASTIGSDKSVRRCKKFCAQQNCRKSSMGAFHRRIQDFLGGGSRKSSSGYVLTAYA